MIDGLRKELALPVCTVRCNRVRKPYLLFMVRDQLRTKHLAQYFRDQMCVGSQVDGIRLFKTPGESVIRNSSDVHISVPRLVLFHTKLAPRIC